MSLPKELTTVTPLSKILALLVFITVPFIAFHLGIQYKSVSMSIQNEENNQHIKPAINKAKQNGENLEYKGTFEIAITGAEVLLIDSKDRKSGFNPKNREIIDEIPESMYFNSKIVPPGGSDNGTIVRTLLLSNISSNYYNLEIFGSQDSSSILKFFITLDLLDTNYHRDQATISGTLLPEQKRTYHIDITTDYKLQVLPIENNIF